MEGVWRAVAAVVSDGVGVEVVAVVAVAVRCSVKICPQSCMNIALLRYEGFSFADSSFMKCCKGLQWRGVSSPLSTARI